MKILVAMSGGVDSSVAAGILRDQGHEVVGATLKLWGGNSDSGCCSVGDVDDARRVAQVLGLDHHVFNFTEEFDRHVVDPFVAGHAEGRTPNPCIECNRHLKFDLLFARAARLGFDAVATGHHARVVRRHGAARLARGVDEAKDQSYVLGFLDEATLEQLLLPIGEMTKTEVRESANQLGLRVANKPDSQDVCFIEKSAGREAFLSSRISLTPATIVDVSTGDVIGTTDAAELVTVGQRRGVAPGRDGERRFVTRVDLASRRVEVDRLAAVLSAVVQLDPRSINFVATPLASGAAVIVQTSAHGRPVNATFERNADGSCRLVLEVAARPVASGQTVVMYELLDPTVVAGAAIVTRP